MIEATHLHPVALGEALEQQSMAGTSLARE